MAATYRKKKDPGATPTRNPNRAAKTIMALDLLKQGKTYRQIAAALGVRNPGSVHHMVQEELNRCLSLEVHTYRELQNQRLNALLDSVWKPATDETNKDRTWFVDRALNIIAQQNKLNGLDAPVSVNVTAQATSLGISVVLEQMRDNPRLAEAAADFVGLIDAAR